MRGVGREGGVAGTGGESGEGERVAGMIWMRETLIGVMLTILRSGGDGERGAGMTWMRETLGGDMWTILLSGGDGGESIRRLDSRSMSGVGRRKDGGGMKGGLSERSGLCGETGLWTGKSEVGDEAYEAGLEERSVHAIRVGEVNVRVNG